MKTLHQFLLEAKGEEEPEESEDDREGHLGWGEDDVEFDDDEGEDSQLKEAKAKPITHEELGTTVHEGSIGDADEHTPADHDEFNRVRGLLSPKQKTIVSRYKNSSYTLNRMLRNKHSGHDYEDDIKHLRAAVESSSLHRDMHVYRGFSGSLPMEKLKPGMKFTDHGFTGTTHKAKVASSFAKIHFAKVGKETHPVVTMAKIHLPKGTKALHLDAKSANHKHKNEAETLVQHGTTYRVTHHTFHRDDKNKRHYHIVHMTVDSQK